MLDCILCCMILIVCWKLSYMIHKYCKKIEYWCHGDMIGSWADVGAPQEVELIQGHLLGQAPCQTRRESSIQWDICSTWNFKKINKRYFFKKKKKGEGTKEGMQNGTHTS